MGAWLALVPALLLLALTLVHGPQAGSLDDAFVVWSDARDLVGQGVLPESTGVLGERAPVEGSTSLLDVALKAAVLRIWPELDPLRAAGWLGLLWLVVLLIVAARAAQRWTGSALLAGLVASLVAISPGLVESAGYLLEGPLFALLWVLSIVAAVDSRPGACAAWSVMLAAARPEGLLLAPILVLWAGYRARSQRATSSLPTGFPWGWAAVGLGCCSLVTAVRWLRFREIVPNTYYAKASDSPWHELQDGLGYLRAAVWGTADASSRASFSSMAVGLSIAASAVWLWYRSRGSASPSGNGVGRGSGQDAAPGLLFLSALYALGVAVSGGDSYEGARLFMPIALPLWLGMAATWRHEGGASPGGLGGLVVPSLLLLGLVPSAIGSSSEVWRRPSLLFSSTGRALSHGPVGLEAFDGDAETFRAVAAALGTDGVFAHVHNQRFRWFEPSTHVLDLTGLTNRRIARLPAQGRIRFGRFALPEALKEGVGAIHLDPQRGRPTSIVDAPGLVEALSDPSVAGRYVGEPFVDPALARAIAVDYVGASRTLPLGQGYFNLLIHRDRVADFRGQGFRVAAPQSMSPDK